MVKQLAKKMVKTKSKKNAAARKAAELRVFRKTNKRLVQRGSAYVRENAAWGASAARSAPGRFTWYVALRVRQDVRGDVSDIERVDAKAPAKVVTVALLREVASGPNRGTLRRMTYAELARDFDDLVDREVARHGLVPAGRDYVRAVFRHREA